MVKRASVKLNIELIATLSITAQWLRSCTERHGIPFPNSSTYASLINKADALIQEIASNCPDYEKISRRKVTDLRWNDETDEDVPEPVFPAYMRVPDLSPQAGEDVTRTLHYKLAFLSNSYAIFDCSSL